VVFLRPKRHGNKQRLQVGTEKYNKKRLTKSRERNNIDIENDSQYQKNNFGLRDEVKV